MISDLNIKRKCNQSKDKSDIEQEEVNIEELLMQLDILNLSMDTILVIILAIGLNYLYLYYTRVKLLDTINNTNFADCLFDASEFPKIANVMILYGTGIFLDINYSNFIKLNSVKGEDRDEKAISRAYRAFISSILVFIASAISRTNIEV